MKKLSCLAAILLVSCTQPLAQGRASSSSSGPLTLDAGTVISIRLTSDVSTTRSRSGDRVSAVVIAPVVHRDRVLIAPGAEAQGVVNRVRKANPLLKKPAELVLDFDKFLDRNSNNIALLTVPTTVMSVDNAREGVESGVIKGIPFPDPLSKENIQLAALSLSNPKLAGALGIL